MSSFRFHHFSSRLQLTLFCLSTPSLSTTSDQKKKSSPLMIISTEIKLTTKRQAQRTREKMHSIYKTTESEHVQTLRK